MTHKPCKACGTSLDWRDCYNCDEGVTGHDCGEDTCCCLEPEMNEMCDICNGRGGFMVCATCYPEED